MLLTVDAIVGSAWAFVEVFGLPLLFVIFVLKGALVGKIFPTSVFLPGYVILVGASRVEAGIVVVVTAIAFLLGQLVLYRGTSKYGMEFVSWIPYTKEPDFDSPRFQRFDEWFNSYGGLSIFASNFLPWVRGLLLFPAATSSYSSIRFAVYTFTATLVYHAIYVVLALLGLELLAEWGVLS